MDHTPTFQHATDYTYGDQAGRLQYAVIGPRGSFLITRAEDDHSAPWQVRRDGARALLYSGPLLAARERARHYATHGPPPRPPPRPR